jgi:MFS family permease
MSTAVPGSPAIAEDDLYTRAFWWAYVANLLLVTANALTFRFAEFVNFLGGTEESTGEIVRAGVIGSILIRFTLARDLDRLGVRRLWISSSLLFVFGAGLLLLSESVGWQVYLARAAFAIGLASMFTCSNVHIQSQAPLHRRTEAIASLGSSGFLGMVLGAQLGDLMFDRLPRGDLLFVVLFGTTAALGAAYLFIVLRLTRHDIPVQPTQSPPVWKLVLQYSPRPLVLVALAMGVGFVVTTVFLTRHATSLGLVGVRTFFTGYALSAFAFRLVSRRWSRTVGRHRMILIGLTGHVVGHLLLINVAAEWDFVLPSLLCGFGHALLFPCVVSLGAESYPEEYRGAGTTAILGFVDVGMAVAAQPLGWVIDHFGFTTMYLSTAGFCLTSLAIYGVLRGNAYDEDRERARRSFAAAAHPEAAPSARVEPPNERLAGSTSGETLTPIGALQR